MSGLNHPTRTKHTLSLSVLDQNVVRSEAQRRDGEQGCHARTGLFRGRLILGGEAADGSGGQRTAVGREAADIRASDGGAQGGSEAGKGCSEGHEWLSGMFLEGKRSRSRGRGQGQGSGGVCSAGHRRVQNWNCSLVTSARSHPKIFCAPTSSPVFDAVDSFSLQKHPHLNLLQQTLLQLRSNPRKNASQEGRQGREDPTGSSLQ